jgi:hypothetical protein
MAVAAPIVIGVAGAALSASQQAAQQAAQANATGERNDAAGRAANQTADAQLAQLDFSVSNERQNVSARDQAVQGALSATSAARGLSGSRTAVAISDNFTQQAGLQLMDIAQSAFMERVQIEIDRSNGLNGRQSFQGMPAGLMLAGAGLQGLQTGLSAYQSGVFEGM